MVTMANDTMDSTRRHVASFPRCLCDCQIRLGLEPKLVSMCFSGRSRGGFLFQLEAQRRSRVVRKFLRYCAQALSFIKHFRSRTSLQRRAQRAYVGPGFPLSRCLDHDGLRRCTLQAFRVGSGAHTLTLSLNSRPELPFRCRIKEPLERFRLNVH